MSDRVYVIAEAGVNHNGDVGRALAMIDVAADAGADAVKFQTFVPSALASAGAHKADYQRRNDPGDDSQLAMLQRLALPFDQQRRLLLHCQQRDIDFLSSPFDTASATFLLDDLALPTIKLGSGELLNAPLLWQVAASDAGLILSTGMATLDDVRLALGVCCLAGDGIAPRSPQHCRDACEPSRIADRVRLMHCTTAYPCPPGDVNLRAMDTLRDATGLEVGYSDHTTGIAVGLAAVARGARLIEKHFTLDRALPGPDHAASLDPAGLRALVDGVRTVSQALGSAHKRPGAAEMANAGAARKSLVAAAAIRAGEPFTPATLTSKRPGDGVSPLHYWALLGQPAKRDYAADELIDADEAGHADPA
ncbi:MAG: N-acetylneuraminate synthase [Gammaproteobacteria bacterium]|nr:N-acetylneuraminate synthase [Gammaproteobacteria bacterium]